MFSEGPVHSCSVTKLCLTSCNPINCNKSGFPVFYYPTEFVPTHVHWVSDDIQPSHVLLPPSPVALNLSQHQDCSQWISSSHEVPRELELLLQHESFQWMVKGQCVVRIQYFYVHLYHLWGFPSGSDGKKSSCNVEDLGSIAGQGRSSVEGNG